MLDKFEVLDKLDMLDKFDMLDQFGMLDLFDMLDIWNVRRIWNIGKFDMLDRFETLANSKLPFERLDSCFLFLFRGVEALKQVEKTKILLNILSGMTIEKLCKNDFIC